MSPRSRGRPPGRGRRRPRQNPRRGSQGLRQLGGSPSGLSDSGLAVPGGDTDCWFDEPVPGDRRSWAMPAGHGRYDGIELEWLDRDDEDDRMVLMEAMHAEFGDALRNDEEITIGGEQISPRLHVTIHQIVANQLIADDPPDAWRTVQRLAGVGYDWHNIMHMIMGLVASDVHAALTGQQEFDAAGYVRRLDELPADWPSPDELA